MLDQQVHWFPRTSAEDTIKGQPTLLGEAIASILLGVDDVRDGIRTLQAQLMVSEGYMMLIG